ncbi:YlqD family protein [Mesobacillus maritimus]|uniref:YlqD family protein n=1 Tax=Mesobacillus maritimus TaxID=1643336 RepID=UPI00203B5084|nr:YlqD family protein [Mesobacillus maritimus]MCM3667726.1 YlqD family protein [Mesobacillus maritimus]
MKLIQTVVVKQVLTEKSKNKLLSNYEGKKFQLQKECDQLKFEMKKQEKAKKFSPEILKKQFEKEIGIRNEKIKLLDFHMEQLHILPVGSELKESEHQALVEVNEGDKWDDFLFEKTIVVKDGIVVEIRER